VLVTSRTLRSRLRPRSCRPGQPTAKRRSCSDSITRSPARPSAAALASSNLRLDAAARDVCRRLALRVTIQARGLACRGAEDHVRTRGQPTVDPEDHELINLVDCSPSLVSLPRRRRVFGMQVDAGAGVSAAALTATKRVPASLAQLPSYWFGQQRLGPPRRPAARATGPGGRCAAVLGVISSLIARWSSGRGQAHHPVRAATGRVLTPALAALVRAAGAAGREVHHVKPRAVAACGRPRRVLPTWLSTIPAKTLQQTVGPITRSAELSTSLGLPLVAAQQRPSACSRAMLPRRSVAGGAPLDDLESRRVPVPAQAPASWAPAARHASGSSGDLICCSLPPCSDTAAASRSAVHRGGLGPGRELVHATWRIRSPVATSPGQVRVPTTDECHARGVRLNHRQSATAPVSRLAAVLVDLCSCRARAVS